MGGDGGRGCLFEDSIPKWTSSQADTETFSNSGRLLEKKIGGERLRENWLAIRNIFVTAAYMACLIKSRRVSGSYENVTKRYK